MSHHRSFASAVVLCCFITLSSGIAVGQQFDPKSRAATIAPYLDSEAILVGRLDLRHIDAAATLEHVNELVPLGDREKAGLAASQKMFEMFRESFVKAGGGELFLVLRLADIPQSGPFVIAPVKANGDAEALVDMLKPLSGRQPFDICERLDNVVYLGPEATLRELRSLEAKPRPQLADAFAAAGDTAAQLLILPTDDHRRVIREMLPRLPVELGEASGAELADGFQWAAVGVQFPPKLSLELTIQARDAKSAAAVKEALVGGVKLLKEVDAVSELHPIIDELSRVMTPSIEGNRLQLALNQENGGVEKLVKTFQPILFAARSQAQRSESVHHLKQLGLAMHNYHDRHKSFPASASFDDDGKPLLSWRVHVLPYIEGKELYDQFHLDEPWDSPHNIKLIEKMPETYSSPAHRELNVAGRTMYLAPAGEGLAFEGKEGIRIRDFMDGTSNTILLVEAAPDKAVIWTKPDDLQINLEKPLAGLVAPESKGFNALFCDGSVRFISKEVDTKILRLLFTRADGEPIPQF